MVYSLYKAGYAEGEKSGEVQGKLDGFSTGVQKGLEYGREASISSQSVFFFFAISTSYVLQLLF